MPNDRQVYLDVRNFSSDAPFKNVTASNGQPYSYCYTGGDDGQGGASFSKANGQGTVKVNFVATTDQRYTVASPNGVTFTGDGANDFSFQPIQGGRGVIINDTVNDAESVKYSVIINDSVANCTVTCDPQIINRS